MTTASGIYPCARCGKKLRGGRWVYSATTRSRYCIEIDACAKRAKRKR